MEGEECEILEDTGGKETYDTGEQLTQLYAYTPWPNVFVHYQISMY